MTKKVRIRAGKKLGSEPSGAALQIIVQEVLLERQKHALLKKLKHCHKDEKRLLRVELGVVRGKLDALKVAKAAVKRLDKLRQS